ncbi:MAG: hypothetical protein HQK55_15730, partial [Deltaproteobacteria bacterium]|nr:hypothetical protein [Deltaproteobacteria bacterium]
YQNFYKERDKSMKKRCFVIFLAACALFLIATTNAVTANPNWYVVSIKQVGVGWGDYYINLSDTNNYFTGRWFRLPTANRKEMLAVTLAAASSGMQARVFIDADTEYSDITAVYVITP